MNAAKKLWDQKYKEGIHSEKLARLFISEVILVSQSSCETRFCRSCVFEVPPHSALLHQFH